MPQWRGDVTLWTVRPKAGGELTRQQLTVTLGKSSDGHLGDSVQRSLQTWSPLEEEGEELSKGPSQNHRSTHRRQEAPGR